MVVDLRSSGPSSSDTSDDRCPSCPVHCFCWKDRKHVFSANYVTDSKVVTTKTEG